MRRKKRPSLLLNEALAFLGRGVARMNLTFEWTKSQTV
jgi:hypothetical protein